MALYKKDEEAGVGFFLQDVTTVLQEARVFNESPISPRKCRILLTKIIYLLYAGETFGTQEATTLFFGVTKLFQHKDPALRQMVYLVIKELSKIADDVIMVTSSIMKDMQPNLEVVYRPNAIRALCRVIDGSMIQGVERFFKSAIVDKSVPISSAALVSSYHLSPVARDVIKRWANEANEGIVAKTSSATMGAPPSGYQSAPSSSYITQYHALGLLYIIRQQDRMAVSKLIQQLSGAGRGGTSSLRSPHAICMLIRFAAKVMDEDPNLHRQMYEVLEGLLRHKSDMVNYEAARTICEMRSVSSSELARPIQVLTAFLASTKSTLKFAAIRTLSRLAQVHPGPVSACNLDMEKLINDDNRSVATYAITTLLKTGNEASVDRLMKQISSFMGEISDEFKVIVVNAIRSLCLKFPAKQSVMLTFLSGVLRDEGGYDFKRAVVEAIFDMIKFIGDSKEAALAQLCEFIEDCEFTKLSVRILHLLGVEGPKAPQPTKYIRYIYNRVVLENAIVRAAAVSSLAKFGVNVADTTVKTSIRVLLRRCLDDVDDEVRDRAALYLKVLDEDLLAEAFVRDESTFSIAALEDQLATYISQPAGLDSPFDVGAVPRISREQAREEALRSRKEMPIGDASAAQAHIGTSDAIAPAATAAESQSLYAQQLAEVPELASYGKVLKSSSKPIELSESETEYVVTAVKHVFSEHIVFQFNIRNTLQDTILENVSVIMTATTETHLVEDFIIPIDKLDATTPAVVYVSFSRASATDFAMASFSCSLKFVSKEVDPSSGEPEEEGYEDEYQVEEIELGAGDYIVPSYATFKSEWERLSTGATATETFALSALESLKAACDTLIEILNMEPLGGTEIPTSSSVHTLTLSGLVCGGGGPVLARSRMTFSSGNGVTMELSVRAEKEEACALSTMPVRKRILIEPSESDSSSPQRQYEQPKDWEEQSMLQIGTLAPIESESLVLVSPSFQELPLAHARVSASALSAPQPSQTLIIKAQDPSAIRSPESEVFVQTVGRSSNCHLSLLDPRVSAIHCRLSTLCLDSGEAFVRLQDVSMNGTVLNDDRLIHNHSVLLNDGDVVAFASHRFVFRQLVGALSMSSADLIYAQQGDYVIYNRVLGQGSFATVHLAYNTVLRRQCACKIIDRKKINASNQATLQREHVMLARIDHPNISRFWDLYDTPKQSLAFIELVNGGDLFDYLIRRGTLDRVEVKVIAYQLFKALEYLHCTAKIAHRDLKLENVLVDGDGPCPRIVLADFGTARPSGQLAGTLCGTCTYMAPEVLSSLSRNIAYDGQLQDCWGAGLMLFMLASGEHPFDVPDKAATHAQDNSSFCAFLNDVVPEPSGQAYLARARRGQINFTSAVWQRHDPDIIDLVKQLLCVDPESRSSIAQALEHTWFVKSRSELEAIYDRLACCQPAGHRASILVQPTCLERSTGIGDHTYRPAEREQARLLGGSARAIWEGGQDPADLLSGHHLVSHAVYSSSTASTGRDCLCRLTSLVRIQSCLTRFVTR
ncbi:hypothetical protein E5Q_04141 [Mixia osmundae IAM 14324]|uniref:Gamma-coat protein n=1 Tax=Mixia osmundae (strain CBS 9802 / IAM 14324 / JCM 22182 / KY 12970) TaxID=764103 RepID=G7E3Q2_MIXOS|nr:hypothetical protein E5Q_04141 [Mixia osmundae IAM 14324]